MPRLVFLFALGLVVTVLVLWWTDSAHGAEPVSWKGRSTIKECARWEGHLLEACGAYIVNDAHWSLQPYYKYVNSDSMFSGLKNRFFLKYKGAARAKIQAWTGATSWESGTNTVDGPHIKVLDGDSSLKCNRAVLVTLESWLVISQAGDPLLVDYRQVYTVRLRRIEDERFMLDGRSLHAWAVFDIFKGRKVIPVC